MKRFQNASTIFGVGLGGVGFGSGGAMGNSIIGAQMYLNEGEQCGFNTIPVGIYWIIVTLFTGIVSLELVRLLSHIVSTQACTACGREGHDVDARYCKYCGVGL